MTNLKNVTLFLFIALLSFGFAPHQNDFSQKKVPFIIVEKSYFYYVSGKKATNGFKIQIVGTYDTTNLEFTTIYFQNRELKIIPNFHLDKFTLVGGYTTLSSKDILVDEIALNNEVAKKDSNDIPFELEDDQAVLVYQINGKDFYYKISDIEKLETVYYP
jgi:hypothetical protein